VNLRAAPNLPGTLAKVFLVIDTCTLINAIRTEDFRVLLEKIKNAGCELFSIEAAGLNIAYLTNHHRFAILKIS